MNFFRLIIKKLFSNVYCLLKSMTKIGIAGELLFNVGPNILPGVAFSLDLKWL